MNKKEAEKLKKENLKKWKTLRNFKKEKKSKKKGYNL